MNHKLLRLKREALALLDAKRRQKNKKTLPVEKWGRSKVASMIKGLKDPDGSLDISKCMKKYDWADDPAAYCKALEKRGKALGLLKKLTVRT